MALKSRLGFGMMRLPVKNGNPTDFDYDELNRMVDTFIEAGYTYFDTSYVYHNGKSEEATRKAVVERYPRDAFTVATKFPTFSLEREDQIEPIFAGQLENLGVDYIDYYLLHNFQTVYYDGIDGKGGIVKTAHLFDYANKWKADGKIKHLGFSFHSSAKLLDRILTEHPEVEFVQIPFNYIDAESELVQAMQAYEVIRKHGKLAVFMEPVKGGGLSMVPAAVEQRLKEMNPNASIASWAIRYAGSFDGVICNLSGMSTLAQVQDNVSYMRDFTPLSAEEQAVIERAQAALGSVHQYKCTACHYCCEGCPQQIPIPDFLAAMNRKLIFEDEVGAKKRYAAAAEKAGVNASDCIACGQCEGACPQGLPIISYLEEVAAALE